MRYMVLVILLMCVGCAGKVTISTEIVGPDGWEWTQTVKGASDAAVEAAKQTFSGELKTDSVTVTLKSGQDATNMATKESEMLKGILGEAVVAALGAAK